VELLEIKFEVKGCKGGAESNEREEWEKNEIPQLFMFCCECKLDCWNFWGWKGCGWCWETKFG
jgi:hypothetical protein